MNIVDALLYIWLFAIGTAGFTYIFRSNVFFSATMQLVIGTVAGNLFVVSWNSYLKNHITPIMTGASLYKIVYVAIAFLLFATFFTKWRWLSRYPTSILAGTGLGLALRNGMWTDVLSQIQSSMYALTGNLIIDFSNIIFVVILALSLFYFIFGVELKGPWTTLMKYTRLTLMAAMGVEVGGYLYGSASLNLTNIQLLKSYLDAAWQALIV